MKLVVFLLISCSLVCSCYAFFPGPMGAAIRQPMRIGQLQMNKYRDRDGSQKGRPSLEKQVPPTRKPNKRDTRLETMLESVEYSRSTSDYKPLPIREDPLVPMVEAIVRAADKRKATSINAFRICHLTEVTTFMVVIEGNSRPQNQAIALAVEEDLLMDHQESPNKEGDAASGWILLDYASVIVHIMTPQMRNFYKLEKRWKDSEQLDLSEVLLPENAGGSGDVYNAENDAEFRAEAEEQELSEEEDPFWS